MWLTFATKNKKNQPMHSDFHTLMTRRSNHAGTTGQGFKVTPQDIHHPAVATPPQIKIGETKIIINASQ